MKYKKERKKQCNMSKATHGSNQAVLSDPGDSHERQEAVLHHYQPAKIQRKSISKYE
jgi:hypothetical protein